MVYNVSYYNTLSLFLTLPLCLYLILVDYLNSLYNAKMCLQFLLICLICWAILNPELATLPILLPCIIGLFWPI